MVVPSREVAVYMMVLRGSRGRLAWPLLPMLRMSDHGMDTASARAAGTPQWRPVSFTERHRGGFVQAECAYRSAARVTGGEPGLGGGLPWTTPAICTPVPGAGVSLLPEPNPP